MWRLLAALQENFEPLMIDTLCVSSFSLKSPTLRSSEFYRPISLVHPAFASGAYVCCGASEWPTDLPMNTARAKYVFILEHEKVKRQAHNFCDLFPPYDGSLDPLFLQDFENSSTLKADLRNFRQNMDLLNSVKRQQAVVLAINTVNMAEEAIEGAHQTMYSDNKLYPSKVHKRSGGTKYGVSSDIIRYRSMLEYVTELFRKQIPASFESYVILTDITQPYKTLQKLSRCRKDGEKRFRWDSDLTVTRLINVSLIQYFDQDISCFL